MKGILRRGITSGVNEYAARQQAFMEKEYLIEVDRQDRAIGERTKKEGRRG